MKTQAAETQKEIEETILRTIDSIIVDKAKTGDISPEQDQRMREQVSELSMTVLKVINQNQ